MEFYVLCFLTLHQVGNKKVFNIVEMLCERLCHVP